MHEVKLQVFSYAFTRIALFDSDTLYIPLLTRQLYYYMQRQPSPTLETIIVRVDFMGVDLVSVDVVEGHQGI